MLFVFKYSVEFFVPIYEYTCAECGNVFEEWVKSASAPESGSCPCPKCGANALRIISNTSFLLKGDGWFNATYPSAKQSTAGQGSAQTGGDAAEKKQDAAKTETK